MKKRGRPRSTDVKLTDREITLLRECAKYNISTVSGDYYRLGGFGCVPIKFSAKSLPSLQSRGLVDNAKGYWKTTEAGLAELAARASENASAT
jgi:hypothetical protein